MCQPIVHLDMRPFDSTPWECLGTYSTTNGIASQWWEAAAREVLGRSHNFNDVKLICKFIRFRDPNTTEEVLSRRSTDWLDAFLLRLCQNNNSKCPCDGGLCKAGDIISIIKPSQRKPFPAWDGDWIFSALNSSTDVSTIAEKLDIQIHSAFCKILFEDWVTWSLGYEDVAISNFLDTVVKFRNGLAQYVRQQRKPINKLLLLQKASLLCCVSVIHY